MRNYLLLSWKLINQNKFFNVMFFMEMIFTFVMIFSVYNRYNEKRSSFDFVENCSELDRSIVMFVPESIDIKVENVIMELFNDIKNNKNYIGKAEIYGEPVTNENGDNGFLTVYDSYTANIFLPKLEEGRYPDNSENSEVLEVILVDNARNNSSLHVGQEIRLENGLSSKIRIVGRAMRENTNLLNRGTNLYSGDGLDLQIMFQNRNQVSMQFLSVKDGIGGNSRSFQLHYFDDDVSQDSINKIVEKFDEYFPTYSVNELKIQSRKILDSRIKNDLPVNIMFMIIFLSGLISVSILNMKKSEKKFKIFRMCGASLRECIFIYFLSYLIILCGAMFSFLTVMKGLYILDNTGRQYAYYIHTNIKLIIISGSIFLAVLATVPMYLKLRKSM